MTNPNSAAAIPLIAIESRQCPECQGPMVLVRIMLEGVNFGLRTFECAKCDHFEKIMIFDDHHLGTSMPSGIHPMGWRPLS